MYRSGAPSKRRHAEADHGARLRRNSPIERQQREQQQPGHRERQARSGRRCADRRDRAANPRAARPTLSVSTSGNIVRLAVAASTPKFEHGDVGQEHHACLDERRRRSRSRRRRAAAATEAASAISTGSAARFSTDHRSGTPIASTAKHGQTRRRLQARRAARVVSSWPMPTTSAASTIASSDGARRIEPPGRRCRRPAATRARRPPSAPTQSGTLIRNSQRQLERSSNPPSNGPSRNATPNTAPMSPSVRPRRSIGTVSAMTARRDRQKAAGAERLDRAAEQQQQANDHAAAATSDPTPNTARLSRNTRRRPAPVGAFGEQRRADQVEQHVDAEHGRQPARLPTANASRIAGSAGPTIAMSSAASKHAGEQHGQRGPLASRSSSSVPAAAARAAASRNSAAAAGWPS